MGLRSARGFWIPLLGMACFWGYFRYQTFFGVLYPIRAEIDAGGFTFQAYTVFLGILFLTSIAAIPLARRIEDALYSRRAIVVAGSIVCSLGAVIALSIEQGVLGAELYWLSALCVALGFLVTYLAWAVYFSSSFSLQTLVLLAASYLASLVLLYAPYEIPWSKMLALTLLPLASGICWFFSSKPPRHEKSEGLKTLKVISPYIAFFIVFILAGSVVRGIVDLGEGADNAPTVRFSVSILISTTILIICWLYARQKEKPKTQSENYASIEKLTLGFWIVLALLFFLGIFIGMVSGSYAVGGHIVVIARSSLDFFFWILLCNLAYHRKASPILLFLVYSLFTEIASWVLSYVVMPHLLLVESQTGRAAYDMVILVMVFALIALITIISGVIALRKQPLVAEPQAADSPARDRGITGAAPPHVLESKAEEYRLTAREVEVIDLFSQGLSLKRVAEKLFISTSTAQSHIKSAYRKLDIHSKDELIELIASWYT